MGVSVRAYGPVFDGTADREIHDAARQMEDDIAKVAKSDWVILMKGTFQDPTPYYWTQIATERKGGGVVVHDRGIIYGFWLEGIGSRNWPVTSFRGYHNALHAKQAVQIRAVEIGERTLRPYLERING